MENMLIHMLERLPISPADRVVSAFTYRDQIIVITECGQMLGIYRDGVGSFSIGNINAWADEEIERRVRQILRERKEG